MEQLNCVAHEFCKEKSANTTVFVNTTNTVLQELSNDSCSKTLNSPKFSNSILNRILNSEEYRPPYQCSKPNDYVFVDVGSDLVSSDFLPEEDNDSCKVSSETLCTDYKDVDHNLVNSVKIEKESVGDALVYCNTENINCEIKKEVINNDEEEMIINESISDMKLHPEYFKKCSDNFNEEIEIKSDDTLHEPSKATEAVQSETETCMQTQNILQNPSKTCSELQIKLNTNSIDYNATDGQQECINKLGEVDKNMGVKSRIDEIYQHQENGKSEDTTDRHLCEVCNKSFMHMRNLMLHRRIHTGESPFVCNICGKIFTYQIYLERHIGVHTGDRPFDCNICGKAFNQLTTLKNHKRIHSGDRPFVCNMCGKAFKQLATLGKHKIVHTGDRPFGCNVCGKAFTLRNTLTKHKRIHTGEKPFGCNICRKAFTEQRSLKEHERIHTGDRPFSCDLCGKAFIRKKTLTRHKCIFAEDLTI